MLAASDDTGCTKADWESDVHRESLSEWLLFLKACLTILLVRLVYISLPQIGQMEMTKLGFRNTDKAG